ncbi:MAG: malonic semialdehyde reductase [Pseudomonadota bacterium]
MTDMLADGALDTLFRTARSQNGWKDEAVPETLMRAVYDLHNWGPTSANCSPARYVFISTAEGKERLKPLLAPGNVDKTMAAPWTVIVAYDMKFADKLTELFPMNPDVKNWFAAPEMAFDTAFRNGTLQGGYLMMAARALGLDCGPMSGFNKDGVDKEFFGDDEVMSSWKSNWLCNIGHGDEAAIFPRLPRLSFEDAVRLA